MEEKNLIKKVYIKKNVLLENTHHNNLGYLFKDVLFIEYYNGDIYRLDLNSMTDISSSDYIQVVEVEDMSREEIIFENTLEHIKEICKGKKK